ncbi:MAG: hypothetical protein ACRDHW_07275, partial [Ktedonobacteraceae bacterium]
CALISCGYTMHECHFCGQASLDGLATIQHKKDCIIPLAETEWEKMNAEFIRVLNLEEAAD